MDDMFVLIFNTLSIEAKLRTAVTNNMLDYVDKLLQESGPALVNAPLYIQNQRTALHLACEQGLQTMVKLLIDAKGDVNAVDLFGFTPLTLALRHRQEKCALLILQNCSWHPGIIWQSTEEVDRQRRPNWADYSEDILCLMVIGTPNLLVTDNFTQFEFHFFTELCAKYQKLVKAFYLTGNQLPPGHNILELLRDSANLSQWIRAIRGVQSLQHCARIAVRRRLKTNVYFGAKHLPLPVSLQAYLCLVDEL